MPIIESSADAVAASDNNINASLFNLIEMYTGQNFDKCMT